MLTCVERTYCNGRVKLTEKPIDVDEGTRVIVTFIRSISFDLASQGINKVQAEMLRSHL